MQLECFDTGIFDSNCYIIWDEKTNEGVAIDAGVDAVQIVDFLKENSINLKYILMTHCHFDHLYFIEGLKEKTKAQTVIHKLDSLGFDDSKVNCSSRFGSNMSFGKADIILDDENTLSIGDLVFEIIHTPGHSPGSICIKVGDAVFTGDTLFNGSIGRVDLPFSSPADIVSSIYTKLYTLPSQTIIYPGHGSSSTIGFEILNNLALKGKKNEA